MKNKDLICKNLNIDDSGVLSFSGVNVLTLSKKYGTPLFLMDENRIGLLFRIIKARFYFISFYCAMIW